MLLERLRREAARRDIVRTMTMKNDDESNGTCVVPAGVCILPLSACQTRHATAHCG